MDNMDDFEIPKWVSFTKDWHTGPYADISPYRKELSAAGKNVVVTGGGTGIGKAIAIAFAQAGAASVSILGRRRDRLESSSVEISKAGTSNTKVLYRVVDLQNRAQVDDGLKTITDAVGKIDIFVNNAGALSPLLPVAKYDAATFMEAFGKNVLTSLNAIQAFLPLAAEDAVVINISASVVHIRPLPFMSAYAASKTAQLKMVEQFAAENPDMHIVSLQPGMIETEIAGPDSNIKGQDEGKWIHIVAPKLPALALIDLVVELPAHFSVWLASDEAKFLKGKFLWANWDVPELIRRAGEIRDSRLLTVGLSGVEM